MALDPSEMFKVLGVETRIRIIELLKSRGPLGTKNIAELIDVTPAAVSQHLKILRQAGFVRSERKGYWIPYSIDAKAMLKCRETLTEACSSCCPDSADSELESLKTYAKRLENELNIVKKRIKDAKSSGK